MNKEDLEYHECDLFDGHNTFPDIECVLCGKKYRIKGYNEPKSDKPLNTPAPKSLLYLHETGLTIKETETEIRITHADIEFTSVISKTGTDATRGQATPTWKYIEYLKDNSTITL